jgi:hypothetical protein
VLDDVAGREPVQFDPIGAEGHQSAIGYEPAEGVDRGQPVPGGERDDQIARSYLVDDAVSVSLRG